MKIQVKILNKEFYGQRMPRYQTAGSAGMDLYCTEDILLSPGETKLIPTGLAVWIGSGLNTSETMGSVDIMGMIVPRSSLGTKGLILANTIGVLDEDYQGELILAAHNRLPSNKGITIEYNTLSISAGDRIAQLIFVPVIKARWQLVDEFDNKTDRGVNGLGSTGV